jgi:hypothetical protein
MTTQPGPDPEQRVADESWWHRFLPLHTAPATARLLHLTKAQLADLVESRDVLMLTAEDGDVRFPDFQFGNDNTPLPHLREAIEQIEVSLRRIDVATADPWVVALRLTSKTAVRSGRTAAELLRTEHSDEVLWQLAWDRIPLDQRANEAETMAIARPIAERIIELSQGLPVELNLGTLFTTTRSRETFAAIAFTANHQVYALRYPIDDNSEETAQMIATGLRHQFPTADPRNEQGQRTGQ